MSQDSRDARTVTYVPKRDRWITLVHWATALLSAWLAFRVAAAPIAPTAKVGVAVCYGVVVFVCVAPLYLLSYKLSNQTLRMGFGPVRMTVPLDSIESATPGVKAGLTWSWSLALRGVVITRRGRRWKVFISPLSRDDFLRDLAARCPHLEFRDGGLAPRG